VSNKQKKNENPIIKNLLKSKRGEGKENMNTLCWKYLIQCEEAEKKGGRGRRGETHRLSQARLKSMII